MPRLNAEVRARSLAMLECGRTQDQVARRFNVSRSTIARLVQRVRATGTFADRPRSGAPRVTSVGQENYIRQRHLRDRFLTAESTSRLVIGNRRVPVSRYTIRRRLLAQGIRCRRPLRGQILTARHRQRRLLWAHNHQVQRRQNVVFGDESRFTLSNADRRVRVYRRLHERFANNCVQDRRRHERYANNCVPEYDRFGGGGVMVWAAINHGFRSQLVVVQGNLTAREYINQILRPVILPTRISFAAR